MNVKIYPLEVILSPVIEVSITTQTSQVSHPSREQRFIHTSWTNSDIDTAYNSLQTMPFLVILLIISVWLMAQPILAKSLNIISISLQILTLPTVMAE